MNASRPSQILIIRHGEKLGDSSDDQVGGPDLSIAGFARAVALPALFVPQNQELSCNLVQNAGFTGTYIKIGAQGSPPRFSTPDFLFATQASQNSNRPIETITPLSVALGLSYNDSYADSDYKNLATAVLTDSKYGNKVILICWHHGKIPKLAKALGVSSPPDWPDPVFDRVWKITYVNGVAQLQNLPQELL